MRLRKELAAVYERLSLLGDRIVLVLCLEAVVLGIALLCAFLLHDRRIPSFGTYIEALLWFVPLRLVLLHFFHLTRGWWRYTGIPELVDIAKAVLLGSIILLAVSAGLPPRRSFTVSFYVLEALASARLLSDARIFPRLIFNFTQARASRARRLVVLGAGHAARVLIHDLEAAPDGYAVVACLDDDPSKHGIRIGDGRVDGGCELLPNIAKRYRADEVWIAIPSARPAEMSRLVELCERTRLPYKFLPRVRDMVEMRPVSQLREVKLEDLLGREPVVAELNSVRQVIAGRGVLVTGAAGSIGSELCKQLLAYGPATLICLDQSETELFNLQRALTRISGPGKMVCHVADICDLGRVSHILSSHAVNIVFHAAAYKHVTLMEQNPEEAVKTNVFGLLQLLDAATQTGVESFILISSDKAVKPASVMGATKRIGELIMASRPRHNMDCISVRFGNVLGSNGSLIPILQQQLRHDLPLTITDPASKRFFMTVEEAVSLVLQASSIGRHGDLLVLDMGPPVRIVDLVADLIRLNGKEAHEVPIRITGLGPGEKLEEELFYAFERVSPTSCNKVLRTEGPTLSWGELTRLLECLRQAVDQGDPNTIRRAMHAIVPEYTPAEAHLTKAGRAAAERTSPNGQTEERGPAGAAASAAASL